MSNQVAISIFEKCPHILNICYLKYHFWISVYAFIFWKWLCYEVSSQSTNQLQGQWSCMLLSAEIITWPFSKKWKWTLKSQSEFSNIKIFKIGGHFKNLKCILIWHRLLPSYCVCLTKFKFWLDSSLNITLSCGFP